MCSRLMKIADDSYKRDHRNTVTPHRQRVAHRDIKPANIFLRREYASGGEYLPLVLGDFGIATLQPVTEGEGTAYW